MGKKVSIKTKISISVLIVSMICSLMIGYFSFVNYKNNLESYMGKRALDIAQTVSINLDGDKIEQYDKSGKKDDNYQPMIDYLCKIKQNVSLTYLYIITDSGNDYKYIAEGYLDGEEPNILGDTQAKSDYGSEPEQAISTGNGTYTLKMHYDTQYGNLLSGFAPIFNSKRQVVGIVGLDIGTDVINKSMNEYLPILLGIMLFSCIVSYLLIYIVVTKMVVDPMKVLEGASLKLSKGEFEIIFPERYLKKNDEVGNLSKAFVNVAGNMKNITNDISFVLTEMANRNLIVGINNDYKGDFLPIKESINNIIESYNDLLVNFELVAQNVSSGSNHVSNIAQSLAQGSTEQASAIQQLSASIIIVSEDADKNAQNVNLATKYISEVDGGVKLSNDYMQQMLSAMQDINISSNQISDIIKVINGIASQTNILALNAAIEAARAGQAGKAFAVVADEVQNLASKSTEAAKQTSELIQNSISAVKTGVGVAGTTAEALESVLVKTQLVNDTISEVTKASNRQVVAIDEISQGLNQISGVVQNNSATAEESAAASKELFSQATILHEEISKFQLKNKYDAELTPKDELNNSEAEM